MRKLGIGTTVALVLAALLATPVGAGADDERMRAMEERVQALEDNLAESESLIDAQREMLQQHGAALPAVGQGAGLDAFFSNLEVGGHITASYIYNFSNPDANLNTQDHNQFNLDHNSFEVDAIKLELGKAAAEPGTAGFQLDLLLGENNNILSGDLGGFGIDRDGDAGDRGIYVQEAYVSYNYEGTLIRMGKFETLLGYEVIDSPYNPHVTHSVLFTFGIPLVHTGIVASGAMNENIVWALGGVNGFNNGEDFNDNKGVLARVGWEDEGTSILLNAFIGSEGVRGSTTKGFLCFPPFPPAGTTGLPIVECFGDNNNRMQIYELVASMEVDDNTDIWLDAVYGFQELDSDVSAVLGVAASGIEDPQWYALAAGGTFSVDDKTDLSLRGEYFRDDGNFRIGHAPLAVGDAVHWSATGTLSHQLTDNLMARLEYRHDWVEVQGNALGEDVFFKHDGEFDDQQDIGILEVSYTFD